MASTTVRIGYRRSGGFAGIELAADATSESLSADQSQLVDRMLAAGPPEPPGAGRDAATHSSAGADRFEYELSLDDGDRVRTFHWSDADLPESVRPLLEALQARATPLRRG